MSSPGTRPLDAKDTDMTTRLDRIGPLAGVLAGVLGIAGFGTARPGPNTASGGAAIIAYYSKHATGQKTADFLLMLSGASFVVFAAFVRERLAERRSEPFATASLAGAAVLAAGMGIYFGADYTLAADPSHLSAAAAQALNILGDDLYFGVAAGCLVFGLTAGIAALRSAALPKWLGIVAILIGVVGATPGTLGALFALFVWSIITGLVIWSRNREKVDQTADGRLGTF